MNSRMRLYGVLLVMALLTSQVSNASAAGRTTTPIANTILNGKGAPKSSLGNDGDFYIDTRSLLIYGPKTKGKWPSPQSIQGPTGPAGSDGKNGADGRAVTTNANAINGAQGPIGPQGEKGERGEKGETGTAGSPGLPGAMGAAGAPGPAGPAGSSGATGPQGPAGPTGATGPSEVTVIDIPEFVLAVSGSYSHSSTPAFGSLKANQNYVIDIVLSGTSTRSLMLFGGELLSNGITIPANFWRNDFDYVSTTAQKSVYGFHFKAAVRVGATDSTIQVRIIDGRGETTAAPLTLTGKAYITLVGSIR
jgi:hypothetical protein